MSRIRMVCFDLGGVIVRHHRSWREACEATGMPFHEAVADPALVERRRALTRLYHVGGIATTEFFPALADATGGLYDVSQVRRLHDAWVYAEYDGIASVLQRLVDGGRAATGILSNTNEVHWARLAPPPSNPSSGGLPRFPAGLVLEHRHASHLLGLAKPDPAIYRAYESATGCRGGEVLFFDDLQENIDAAAALGWVGERIDHLGDTAAQVAAALERHGLIDPVTPR